MPSLGHEILWQFDESKVSGSTPDGNFSQTWESMKDALLTEQGMLIYLQNNAFYWLPKSAFYSQEDFQQLKQYVQKSVPKHKIV